MNIPGARSLEIEDVQHPLIGLADEPAEWKMLFDSTSSFLRTFLAARDGFEVVARSMSWSQEAARRRKRAIDDAGTPKLELYEVIESAEIELLLALALMTTPKPVPSSPGNYLKLWDKLAVNVSAFAGMQPERFPGDHAREVVVRKVRSQTIHYRNLFQKDDCEAVIRGIFGRFEKVAVAELGFSLSALFNCLLELIVELQNRNWEFLEHVRGIRHAVSRDEALSHIDFFRAAAPIVGRIWAKYGARCRDLESLRGVGFQLSELCHKWIYTLDIAALRAKYSQVLLEAILRLAISTGELRDANPQHFYMNNPLWRRPFVRADDDHLLLLLPGLIYGFPFQILEQFIVGNATLEAAYSRARADYLEESIESHVRSAMPSASVYRGLKWRDDETGREYENDIVAIVGNTIFLFEAKSGKLDDVARRGGDISLVRNFNDLFIEPGKQAQRLERYLGDKKGNAKLWLKATGANVNLDLEKPKVVHKFGICIEHFASITSAKTHFKALGLVKSDDAWAPVLSLGELLLIWSHLDTEVSFYHYLTRRATLEELIDFEGDEQDILSMYLINGLHIEPEQLGGRPIHFMDFDGPVRVQKTPRKDRTDFEVLGISLTGYWKRTLEEVYRDASMRHRFDILQVVLNQSPEALAGIEDRARK